MKFLRLLLVFLCLTQFVEGYSTHIVGGVVYYEYIGNNTFRLYFEIYRDCDRDKEIQIGFDGHNFNPASQNQLPPFYYSIFEEGGSIYNVVRNNDLYISDNDINEISSVIVNKCLKRDGTCVEKGVYTTTFRVPDPSKAYIVQYQRCCRNDGIVNIRNQPGNQDKPGITIKTRIPPVNSFINNSARFKNFPPIFICKDRPFIFDHSATDTDGDQLKYYLSTPLAGLDSDNPANNVQFEGKTPVVWQNPYSENNMIGGTPPMTIDSLTGQLVCTPNQLGRFVVSIEVHEIRNGVIINRFARDFQYNVRPCDIPYANTPYVPGTLDPNTREAVYVKDCEDLTVDFVSSSQNATSYRWEFGDGNNSTQQNPSHTYAAPGTYDVIHYAYKNVNGELCEDKVKRIVEIYPALEAKFTAPEEFCERETIQFTNQSTSDFGTITSYQWDFDDGSSTTVQSPQKVYQQAGTYTVRLTIENSKGCEHTFEKDIIIHPKPLINNVSLDGCIDQEKLVICDVSMTSGNVNRYEWTLPDGSTRTSCIFNYTPTAIGTYNFVLEVESDEGCIDSKTILYTVHPLPIVQTINDTKICYNETITLSTTGASSYQWTPTRYLSDPNVASPICSPVYPDSTTYIVEGTDGNGCVNYDTVSISFFLKYNIDAGPDTSVCLDENSANLQESVQLNGVFDFNAVRWNPPTFLSNSNIKNPVSTPTDNITYYFNGIDINNCTYIDSLTVYALDPSFDIVPLDDVFICQYDDTVIEAKDQGDVSSYLWTPDIWISDNRIRAPRFSPLDTQEYILTLSNYCYTKQDTVIVNVNELPDPGMLELDSICIGDTYQFDLNPGMPNYSWRTTDMTLSDSTIRNPTASPTIHTWYYVTVIDRFGCVNVDSMLLEVNYLPTITIAGNRPYMCLGDSLRLRVVTNDFSTLRWWDARYLLTDTSYINYAFPPDTMTFYLEVTTIQKCVNVDSITINVQKPIQPYAPSPVEMCEGKFANLKAEGGLYYLWTPSDYLNDTIIDTPQANPPTLQNYKVYISNDCFIDSALVDVYVHYPTPITAYQDTTIYRGASVELYAETDEHSVDWSPKNEIYNPLSKNIVVSPRDTTQYVVHTVNQFNCSSYDTVVVNVFGKDVLLIPTGFSPNGDGNNDFFGIVKHLNIKELQLFEVYNRWGEKVFTTTDIDDQWDGSYNDEKCMNGVYVWKVKAQTFDNDIIIRSGNVTLIR